jgi:hypothetical protein
MNVDKINLSYYFKNQETLEGQQDLNIKRKAKHHKNCDNNFVKLLNAISSKLKF